jgi:HPt (histidine-containing phosphotransfer) domain-containing protein
MSKNNVINIAELKNFTGPLGNKELLGFIIHFKEDLASKIERFTQLVSSKDYRGSRNIAHSLKSTAKLIGAKSLCSISADFEEKIDQGDYSDINALREALIIEANTVLHAISEEIEGLG